MDISSANGKGEWHDKSLKWNRNKNTNIFYVHCSNGISLMQICHKCKFKNFTKIVVKIVYFFIVCCDVSIAHSQNVTLILSHSENQN